MKKHTKKTESELLEQCAARFESKSMRIMTVKEYELEFDTTFPKPDPNRKAKPGIVDPMVKSKKKKSAKWTLWDLIVRYLRPWKRRRPG